MATPAVWLTASPCPSSLFLDVSIYLNFLYVSVLPVSQWSEGEVGLHAVPRKPGEADH